MNKYLIRIFDRNMNVIHRIVTDYCTIERAEHLARIECISCAGYTWDVILKNGSAPPETANVIRSVQEQPLIFDNEPIATRLPFRYNDSITQKEDIAMPEMVKSDFGNKAPKNYAEILQFINNAILHHEETVFWDNKPAETDQWETNLIRSYLKGDRSGPLQGAPEPIYK